VVRRALIAAILGTAPAAALAQSSTGSLVIPPLPPLDRPAFRVDVTASPRFETVLDAVRREIATNPRGTADTPPRASGSDQPAIAAVTFDVLPTIAGAIRRVQRARRERTERRIHADVTAELDAFCQANDCAAANEGLLLPK
jgi:hypothetical protein